MTDSIVLRQHCSNGEVLGLPGYANSVLRDRPRLGRSPKTLEVLDDSEGLQSMRSQSGSPLDDEEMK